MRLGSCTVPARLFAALPATAVACRCSHQWQVQRCSASHLGWGPADKTTMPRFKAELTECFMVYEAPFQAQRSRQRLAPVTLQSIRLTLWGVTCNLLHASFMTVHNLVLGADEIERVQAYFGFVCKYYPVDDPSLVGMYTNPNLLAYFLSFLLARSVGGSALYSHTSTANKVLDWIMTTVRPHVRILHHSFTP